MSIKRTRALLLRLPEGREIELARAAVKDAVAAVVSERSMREATPELMAELGMPGSPWRTPAERAAHEAIQDLWLLKSLDGMDLC